MPLYHGGAVFPRAAERLKLRLGLDRILGIERSFRLRERPSRNPGTDGDQSSLDKASDAYLLRSTEESIRRADTAPLAIALWRFGLWNGLGWRGSPWQAAEPPQGREGGI